METCSRNKTTKSGEELGHEKEEHKKYREAKVHEKEKLSNHVSREGNWNEKPTLTKRSRKKKGKGNREE